jgi:hypothetical protein
MTGLALVFLIALVGLVLYRWWLRRGLPRG